MMFNDKYEAVIGLEVHAQLKTNSKLFCGDSAAFGGDANTHISAITMGHPGTLPKTNAKAVEYAVKLGLACNCTIETHNYFARKNYFYPDLPKGYQTSQHTTPICKGGIVSITTSNGTKNIELNRIHMEEDAGKSIHDIDDNNTCVDLNRAGVALLEIVTEPCLQSSEEAYQYVTELRKLVQWIDVCDGNMEEGSLRCDANISIRLKGDTHLGTKVEVKNLNSIRNIKKAIDYEIERMIKVVESGGTITQQTRSFNADNDTTFAIRDKEEANDYRYFACPDLSPFYLSKEYIDAIAAAMPALPNALKQQLIAQFELSPYDAAQICETQATANFFMATAVLTQQYKPIANFINGPIKQWLNENNTTVEQTLLQPQQLADTIQLVQDNLVSFSVAAAKILPVLFTNGVAVAKQIAQQLNVLQTNNTQQLETWIDDVLAKMPDKVTEYKKGKKGLIGLFMGEVKKISNGKADPKTTTTLLQQKLDA
jgi:aspartyl-tRNA(Asn)/glutamyl-tRNA(Gln) amidotransferase subunit B